MNYGLTDKGFVKPSFQTLLEEEQELFRLSFGQDIELSNDSPEGAYVANQAMKKFQIWELIEGLYIAGDPDSADGVHLDRLASIVNVYRIPAQHTKVFAALWGKEGTPVLKGHLTKTVNDELFALSHNVVLSCDNLLGFELNIKTEEAGEYLILIDGREISYTAEPADDKNAICQGLYNVLNGFFPEVYAFVDNGNDGKVIHSKEGRKPFKLFCSDQKIEITRLGAFGVYLSRNPGPVFVPIGGLNEIVAKVKDFENVINYAAGITGRNVESDNELRLEMKYRQRQAWGNEIAIENAIKQEVPNVLYARVYSNRSKVEKDGMPPKSFESLVIGGFDQEIAEKIFDRAPAGIEAYGSTIVTVYDTEGKPWPIGFTRPYPKYIWIKILYEKNHKEDLPVNSGEMMKEYIEEWAVEELSVGVDLIYQKLDIPIYRIRGIRFAKKAIAVTDDLTPPADEAYLRENISIGKREIALIDRSRIIVGELAET